MHFEITASLQSLHKPLTTAQRNSSLFSEAPRLAGKTLRRGQVMRMSEAEFRTNEVMAKRLFDAGAIEIVVVDGDHREDLRTKGMSKAEPKPAPKAPPPPPEPPKAETKEELPPPPPPEMVKNEAFPTPEELVAAVAAENKETEEQIEKVVETALTPAEEKPAAPPPSAPRPVTESKGKKGKR